MGFPREEYWSGFPFPSPGDLLKPEIKPAFSAPRALAGGFFTTEPPGKLSKPWPQITDEEREVQERVNYPSHSESKRKLTFFWRTYYVLRHYTKYSIYFFSFNWRIIALQNYVGFCSTTT